MKTFGQKSLSHYLFYLSKISAIGCILLISFILISLASKNYEIVDNQFKIALPLFSKTFIKGLYQANIITTISLTMLYFTLFFYMLSNVLKTFKAATLFSSKAIKQLNYFAALNLIVGPVLYLATHFIMKKAGIGNIHNVILSILLGIFVLFIAAIFKRGVHVQEENDLTI